MHVFNRSGVARDGTGITIDVPKTWLLVKELLTAPEAPVQWIFMYDPIAAQLLAYAESVHEPEVIVERARKALKQPGDSARHDDHMHVRVYCSRADRMYGCVDGGSMELLAEREAELDASPIAAQWRLAGGAGASALGAPPAAGTAPGPIAGGAGAATARANGAGAAGMSAAGTSGATGAAGRGPRARAQRARVLRGGGGAGGRRANARRAGRAATRARCGRSRAPRYREPRSVWPRAASRFASARSAPLALSDSLHRARTCAERAGDRSAAWRGVSTQQRRRAAHGAAPIKPQAARRTLDHRARRDGVPEPDRAASSAVARACVRAGSRWTCVLWAGPTGGSFGAGNEAAGASALGLALAAGGRGDVSRGRVDSRVAAASTVDAIKLAEARRRRPSRRARRRRTRPRQP